MKAWIWKIFGNDDTWPPPDWFRWWNVVGRLEIRYWMALVFGRKLGWLIRNPCHNLTHYKWGWTAHSPRGKSEKKYKIIPENGDTWGVVGKLNQVGLYMDGKYHHFISYRGKYIEWMHGWEPSSGKFVLLTFRKAKKI